MKKSLFILICVTFIAISIIVLLIYNHQMDKNREKKASLEYENYTVNNILGSSLMTLINKVSDSNEQNGVQKDEKGYYISNGKNSIIIEVKFAERDDIYRMEQISKQGSEIFVKFYNTMSFKCMKKQYHKNTNSISYLYFEQV